VEALIRGHRIFYERLGAGPPVVLLHGGPGLDHSYFRPWLEPLAATRELIFYDQLGNGRSERPDVLACGIDGWAAEVDALCEHLGHPRVALFGHSFGTLIAVACALSYPQRVAALVLCSGAAVFDRRSIEKQDPACRERKPERSRTDQEFRSRWNLMLPYYFCAYKPELGEQLDRAMRYSAKANEHGHRSLERFDVRASRGELRTPTLVLGGRCDWITPTTQGSSRLAEAIPGSQLVVFDRSGHFPWIEETVRFNQVVGDFLDRIAQQGGIDPDDT